MVTHRVKEYLLKGLTELLLPNPGESVFSEGWDHLIILDNCRFDVFLEEHGRRNLPGRVFLKKSLGSWTGEYLRENFRERHDDVVVVTANPFSSVYLRGKVHAIIPVWKTHWNEEHNTVLPGDVYSATIKALKKYPDKRLVVHFLQPHHPYLSLPLKDEGMERIKESVLGKKNRGAVMDEPLNELYLSEIYAKVSLPRLMWAYRENLRIVMPYVELLLHRLPGRVVVTSDHGELFGEYVLSVIPIRVYGHGIGRNPNLVDVPWWVIEEEDREKLRSIKDIEKEIAKIERKLGVRNRGEKLLIKGAVRRLKLRGLV